jgi:hypothetical protein
MLAMQVDDWRRDEEAIEAAVDSWIAVRLTPKVDTNALGLRRISMDRRGEISQARDCAGHPEWILQAGAQWADRSSPLGSALARRDDERAPARPDHH